MTTAAKIGTIQNNSDVESRICHKNDTELQSAVFQ